MASRQHYQWITQITHQHLLAVVEVLLDLCAERALRHPQVAASLALVVHQGTEAVLNVDQLDRHGETRSGVHTWSQSQWQALCMAGLVQGEVSYIHRLNTGR